VIISVLSQLTASPASSQSSLTQSSINVMAAQQHIKKVWYAPHKFEAIQFLSIAHPPTHTSQTLPPLAPPPHIAPDPHFWNDCLAPRLSLIKKG
jgi:hypothetical protein